MDYEKLLELLDENKFVEFMNALDSMNAVDAAELLSSVDDATLPKIFRLMKKDTAAEIFAELDPDTQEKVIQTMRDTEIAKFMDRLFVDDAVDMLEEMPANVVNRILKNTTPQKRQELNRFLNYPPDSAGGIMTSEFLSIHAGMTVADAVETIRHTGVKKETVYVIYVTDRSRVLVGTVELKDLLFARPDEIISDIMNTEVISVPTTEDKESTAALISRYDLLALPVVDSEKRLVGIVTIDDAVDVITEEATEDIEIMAAMAPSDKPYLKTGVFSIWLKRIPWLLLLMISATFTGIIISHYESALGQVVILTAFIPMLMDTGGNAGSQASVTIVRGLSVGEIHMKDIFQVLWKEFRVSLLCGITLSVAAFGKAMLIDRTTPLIALVVSITLFASVVVAKLVGCSLPILAKRLKLDPAVMASPFITTIVDAVSLMIYFSVATLLLHL